MKPALGGQRKRAPRGHVVLLAGVFLGCSAARPVPRGVAPVAPAVVPGAPSTLLRYHPQAAAPMLASLELADGRTLFAGKRGERWLFDPASSTLEAALPAPEELLAVAGGKDGGVWVVGKSGASYHARSPLGPFVAVNVPLSPLARVSAAGRTLLAVGRDQRLVRSTDDGRNWGFAGPDETAFVDVAVDAEGHALALSSPEALWESADGGAHFQRSALPASGVLSLGAEPSGSGLRVTSVLGSSHWGAATTAAVKPLLRLEEVLRHGVKVPLGADAGALVDHSAAFGGPGYLEARAQGDGTRQWQLVSGPLRGPLAARPLAEAKGCSGVVLGSFGQFVYLACFTAASSLSQRAQLFASADGGVSFARVVPDFWAKPAHFRLAVGAGGQLLLSGACPPSVEAPGCAPAGVLYRRPVPTERSQSKATPTPGPGVDPTAPVPASDPDTPGGFELGASIVPALADGATIELGFDTAGRTAFALSGTSKGTSLMLFVSKDGGRRFEGHDLGESTREEDADAGLPLTPGRDGTLSLVLGGRRGTSSLMVLDAEGRVLHVGSPPERALLGAAGLSALAVGVESGNLLESLDGGVSWESRGKLPFAICPSDDRCDVPIRCSSDGCVIGDELTRVGFGPSEDMAIDAYAPVEAGSDTGIERRLRTPLACTLSPAPWHGLPGVRELPDADQASIGETAWFAVAEDAKTGAVRVFHAKGGSQPRVSAAELFPALARPAEFAQNVTLQIEGAAAVRYRVPDERAANARLRSVEVAWDNLFENNLARAQVADAGVYTPGDFERGSGGVQSARPELVSIAEHGLYLRVHTHTRADQPTLFLDGASTVALPAIVWPPAIPRTGHAEMGHFGTHHVGLMLLSRGGALARARLENDRWAFDAAGVGLPDPEAFGVLQIINITYLNGQAALHVEELDERGQSAQALLFPLNAEGPVAGTPLPVPTELELATPPPVCTAAQRAASARLVARAYAGTRHPVIVTDALDPPRALLTGDAVLYGTRANPCVAAFEIHSVPGGAADPGVIEGGIVQLDDLEHAWLLRKPRETGPEGPLVEYRSMSCHFDPNLELSQEIVDAPESLAPKR